MIFIRTPLRGQADYANLAHGMGRRWWYFDAEYSDPPVQENTISRPVLYVDSQLLARYARAAWAKSKEPGFEDTLPRKAEGDTGAGRRRRRPAPLI